MERRLDLLVPTEERLATAGPELRSPVHDEVAPGEQRLARLLQRYSDDPSALQLLLRGLPMPLRITARVIAARELGPARGRQLWRDAFGEEVLRVPVEIPGPPRVESASEEAEFQFARARGLADVVGAIEGFSEERAAALPQSLLDAAEEPIGIAAAVLLRARMNMDMKPPGPWPRLPRGPSSLPSRGDAGVKPILGAVERHAVTVFRSQLLSGSGGADPDSPVLREAIARHGQGEPLPEPIQRQMGSRLGGDFRHVRVHRDTIAAAAADALHARAFTVGNDVFFARGAFDPGSDEGQRLLAHELTHVMQWHQGRVRSSGGGRVQVSRPDDSLEREAESRSTLPRDALSPEAHAAASPARSAEASPAPFDVVIHRQPGPGGSGVYDEDQGVCRVGDGASGTPQVPVSQMSKAQKLGRALEHSLRYVGPEAKAQIQALLQPEVLMELVAVTTVALAAQLTPAGWIVDAALLAYGFWGIGKAAGTAIAEFIKFGTGALHASSDADLDAAGQHFATAVTIAGITAIVALVLHKANRAIPKEFEFPGGPGMATAGGPVIASTVRVVVIRGGRVLVVLDAAQTGVIASHMTGNENSGGGSSSEKPRDTSAAGETGKSEKPPGEKTPTGQKPQAPYRGKPGEEIDPTKVDVYRGGSSFEVTPDQVKIDPATKLVKPTHGLSLDTDMNARAVASRGAHKLTSIPRELKIIQRGTRSETHFEIVPRDPMPLERYQELVKQIRVE